MTQQEIDLSSVVLQRGSHAPGSGAYSLEELVSVLAGDLRSVSPVIAAYCRVLNNRLDDDDRQRLLPYAPRLAGSRGDDALEQRRAYHAADYAVRRFAPLALDAAGFPEQAQQLRDLPAIVDVASALLARNAADAAARAAVGRASSTTNDAATTAAMAAGVTAWDTAWAGDPNYAVRAAARTARTAAMAAPAASDAGQGGVGPAFALLDAMLAMR